jgi:hypothetical protein
VCGAVRGEGRTAKPPENANREPCSAGLHRRIAYTCGAFILILVVWRSSASLASFGDFTLTIPCVGRSTLRTAAQRPVFNRSGLRA